ncbi:MAG: dipeptide/oligopeptide/nickel ABC transporter permease/ATP-binding protein, partial [Actinomycetota bacterium]|nr:dipeptide/oligopeptide/nickel ABC transporter permease/ATP-binding protein [Actinomycetota bacterium]
GTVAGYLGGWTDSLLMRLVDVVLSLPFLPLMIVVGAFLGPGLATLMLVIGAVIWAGPSRELRAQVISAKEREHVQAVRMMGASHGYVLVRHLLPAVTPLVVSQFVSTAKIAILLEASLSFLGLGDPTAQSWGTMLHHAYARSAFLTDAWLWWVLPPGAGIAAAVVSFAFLGYALEERARPQLRTSRPRSPRVRRSRPQTPPSDAAVLTFERLTVDYGHVTAVEEVTLSVAEGEAVGLVGESGSGKTTLVAAALGLLPAPGRVTSGRVTVAGCDLSRLTGAELRRVRGGEVGLVPQDAMNALNPVIRVGEQIAESVRLHHGSSRATARARARDLLELVDVGTQAMKAWPHELSGGMRQRAVIAMALAAEPRVLLADEPTTGLDVVVQASIVRLIEQLRQELGLSLLLVSHDLPVVLRLAERVAVMERGRIVEQGAAHVLAEAPSHPVTRRLLDSVPRLPVAPNTTSAKPS